MDSSPGQKVKYFSILKVVMLHIKLKGKKCTPEYASWNFDLTHTPDLLDWFERSDIEIVQISIFLIELSTKT